MAALFHAARDCESGSLERTSSYESVSVWSRIQRWTTQKNQYGLSSSARLNPLGGVLGDLSQLRIRRGVVQRRPERLMITQLYLGRQDDLPSVRKR